MNLDNAISALPERRKQIFKMSRLDHLPNEEIASRLGLSVRTVEKHTELALRDLRSEKYSSRQYDTDKDERYYKKTGKSLRVRSENIVLCVYG